jgi:hypothetical protein
MSDDTQPPANGNTHQSMNAMNTTSKQQISVKELSRRLDKYDDDNETIEALLKKADVSNVTHRWLKIADSLKFQSFLSDVFNGFSPESKRAARELIKSSDRTNGPTKRDRPWLAVVREINSCGLPVEVNEFFNECMKDARAFWYSFDSVAPFISRSSSPLTIAASNAYLGISKLQRQRKRDTIVWRYYCLFFYDLAIVVGNGQERITSKVLEELLYTLKESDAIADDAETIKANLTSWCAAGQRYSRICKALDSGALFLLPFLSDTV